MPFSAGSLIPFLIALSFAAGLNLYASVATLGILSRAGWIDLPSSLSMLASGWILYSCVFLFLVEVFADRIPFVGLAWNLGHLFLRAPLAALMAYQAATPLSPELQLLITIMSGLIATVAHSSKTATRVMAAEGGAYVPSIALNGSGDLIAVALVWLASRHPIVSAFIVLAFLVLTFYFVRHTYRAVRHELTTLRLRCSNWWAAHHRRTVLTAEVPLRSVRNKD